MVTAIGSRFLAVAPVNPDSHPVALRVEGDGTDSGVACISLYVQAECVGGPDDGDLCGSAADCRSICVGGPTPGSSCVENFNCGPGGACTGHCKKGRLGPDPVFMPAAQWGTTLVGDAEIVPDTLYWVTMECNMGAGAFDSEPASAISWRRGDIDGNGLVNAVDVGRTVDVVKRIIVNEVSVAAANVWNCTLDDAVNALDIAEAVNALRAIPSVCSAPCD